MHKRVASGNLINGRNLPSIEVSWVIPAECCVTFDGAAELLGLERDDRIDGVPAPTNVMEDLLAVEVDVGDDRDLQDIPRSGAIDVRSSLRGEFLAIQEKCRLFGLNGPVNAGGVFLTALRALNTIGGHGEALERLAAERRSVQEFKSEVSRLCEANTGLSIEVTCCTSSRGACRCMCIGRIRFIGISGSCRRWPGYAS